MTDRKEKSREVRPGQGTAPKAKGGGEAPTDDGNEGGTITAAPTNPMLRVIA